MNDLRPMLLASLFLLAGCNKAAALEKKLKSEAPAGCEAYCGTASCGITCREPAAIEKAKLLFVAHCAEVKEIGTKGRVQVVAHMETNQDFDSDTCTFPPK